MVQMIRLQPHDPLPSQNEAHVLVVARFGHADPGETVLEVSVSSPGLRAGPTAASRARNGPRTLDDAVRMASDFANAQGIPRVYAIDRTAGAMGQVAAAHGGNRAFAGRRLADFED